MQEPDKFRTRRRLVRRPTKPPQSAQIRPLEWQDRPLPNSSSSFGNDEDRRSPQFDLPRLPGSEPDRPASSSRALRRVGRDTPPHHDNTRFSLRQLLSHSPPRVAPQPSQRPRDGGQRPQPSSGRSRSHDPRARDPRAHDHRRSHISLQPLKPTRPSAHIQPVRSVTPLHPYGRAAQPNSRNRTADARGFQPGPVKRLAVRPVESVAPVVRRRAGQPLLRRPPSPFLYLTRLLILGVGVGAIMGTVLSVWNPAAKETASTSPPSTAAALVSAQGSRDGQGSSLGGISVPSALRLTQAMTPLSRSIQDLTVQYTGLTPGIFVVDLDNGNYVDLNGNKIFSSASLIKVPILVAFLQDVDSGKIRLDELLTMRQIDMAGEAGDLQDQPVGSQFSALDTATKMITISDNTATNMIIARLGGANALTQRFRGWGLTETVLRSPLPDLTGDNTTSPRDLVNLLASVSQGDLLSLRSRDRLLSIMRNTVAGTLLPSGLGPEAIIAHKTGTINSILGDTGIVDMPNGKRYIVTVIVQRPAEDERAREFIQTISHQIYQYLSQPPANASSGVSPSPTHPLSSTPMPSGTQGSVTPADGRPYSPPSGEIGVPTETNSSSESPSIGGQ
jgi:beta-lactamase class A